MLHVSDVIFSTLHFVKVKYQQKTDYFPIYSNCNYIDLCTFKMTAEIIKSGHIVAIMFSNFLKYFSSGD